MQFYDPKTSVPDERTYKLRILGVNDANPTKEIGQGVVVTRTAEGVYRLQFPTGPDHPGKHIGWRYGFGSVTMTDLLGFTAVRGVYDAVNRRLAFTIGNATNVAADLIANQYLDLEVTFSTNSEAK